VSTGSESEKHRRKHKKSGGGGTTGPGSGGSTGPGSGGTTGPSSGDPVFGQPTPSPDPTSFKNPVTDAGFADVPGVQAVPQPVAVGAEPILTLAQVLGSQGATLTQAILSEINNIGQTTTYNSNQVFTGAAAGTNIYTGDSSTTGSSIDNLYFAPLSSSTVGDSGGSVVQSSSGQYIDLAKFTGTTTTTQALPGDTVSGGVKFTITNADGTTTNFTTTATTVSGLISEINKDGIAGVTASLSTNAATGAATGASTDVGILISNTNNSVVIADATLLDTTSGEVATSLQASNKSTETISYQKGVNETSTNLAATDLSTQGNAQAALTTINAAISNVAAQRGYLGAQVNTLNAVSQVATTQQENITSAQNAVQATDYASATTQLSKFEILSQTGISALAQANSLQQEVTKLLQ